VRLEVEVYRVGGEEELEGIQWPRHWVPTVVSVPRRFLSGVTVVEVAPAAGDPSWQALRVELKHGLPALGMWPDFLQGTVRLHTISGMWLGHNDRPYTLHTAPSEVATRAELPATVVTGGIPVFAGLFLVSLRVPLQKEYRSLTAAQMNAAAGS